MIATAVTVVGLGLIGWRALRDLDSLPGRAAGGVRLATVATRRPPSAGAGPARPALRLVESARPERPVLRLVQPPPAA